MYFYLIIVSAVKEELFSGRFVDQRTDQSPHDGENTWSTNDQNSEKNRSILN